MAWIRITLIVVALVVTALPTRALTVDEARHLLNRTSFGATPEQIEEFTQYTWEEAVDKLLAGVQDTPHTEPPYWIDQPVGGLFALRLLALKSERGEAAQAERESIRQAQDRETYRRKRELKTWWWNEMIRTDSPLTEKLVLFWHNHFTSEIDTVESPELMYQQNQMFRKHCLGNFHEFVVAASKDPAMVVYLDGNSNVKGNPNENFARELLELFTMGEGHYTEQDIKEAARAFTGWRIDNISKRFVFNPKVHDFTEKEFFGQKGKFGGEEIIDIVMKEERVAIFITEKFWKYFISLEPDPDEVARLAAIFRDSEYELKPLLRAMLLSEHFRAPRNRGNLIKSPADLVVGVCRMLDTHPAQSSMIADYGAKLGMDLFQPPDVSGWNDGPEWIDANTLIVRHQLSRLILTPPDPQFIKRYERDLIARRLKAQREKEERKEIERLLANQNSLIDTLEADSGDLSSSDLLAGEMDLDPSLTRLINDKKDPRKEVMAEIAQYRAISLEQWLRKNGFTGDKIDPLRRILLPIEPVRGMEMGAPAEVAVAQMLLDPAFQLK